MLPLKHLIFLVRRHTALIIVDQDITIADFMALVQLCFLACQKCMSLNKTIPKEQKKKFLNRNSTSVTHLELVPHWPSHDPSSYLFLIPSVNNKSAGSYSTHTAHVQKCAGASGKLKMIHHKGTDSTRFMFTSFTGSLGCS